MTMASKLSMQLAAQAWCTDNTRHIVMDEKLAEAFADILDKQRQIKENYEFLRELQALINKHSQEMPSNTPDYILAHYLNHCLQAWNSTIDFRKEHMQDLTNHA